MPKTSPSTLPRPGPLMELPLGLFLCHPNLPRRPNIRAASSACLLSPTGRRLLADEDLREGRGDTQIPGGTVYQGLCGAKYDDLDIEWEGSQAQISERHIPCEWHCFCQAQEIIKEVWVPGCGAHCRFPDYNINNFLLRTEEVPFTWDMNLTNPHNAHLVGIVWPPPKASTQKEGRRELTDLSSPAVNTVESTYHPWRWSPLFFHSSEEHRSFTVNVSTEGANEKLPFLEDFDPRERIRHISESPTGTAQKRTHQQNSDDLGNSQRSTFASPTLKRPRQTNIDGEFSVRIQLPASVSRIETKHPLDAFLRNIMGTDLSAHRALFFAQGFNMEMIHIISRGTVEDVQRVLHDLLLDQGRGLKGRKGLSPLDLFFLKDVLAKLVQAGPK
ncbi:hypothetical protein B0H11DRAFT_2202302 [Mycena galericulata]|nr:hypothetical protein B0H11DRAFT_2202302 [Mycena galericulata]